MLLGAMSTANSHYTPRRSAANAKSTGAGAACRHCSGSGREPRPIDLQFSRSGNRRGELKALSDRSGVPGPVISRTFAGQSVPSLATVVLLAEALGVSESLLIRNPAIWQRLMAELSE